MEEVDEQGFEAWIEANRDSSRNDEYNQSE